MVLYSIVDCHIVWYKLIQNQGSYKLRFLVSPLVLALGTRMWGLCGPSGPLAGQAQGSMFHEVCSTGLLLVRELKSSYHKPETILFTISLSGNLK